jgi:hypothetical protein
MTLARPILRTKPDQGLMQLYDRLAFSLALEAIWEIVAIDRQIHHGGKAVDAGGKARRQRAPGDGAVHGGGGPAYRHGAGASRASAIDAENLEAIGADRAAEQRPTGPLAGGSSSPEPKPGSPKEFSRELTNRKRSKGLKPWSRNRTKPPAPPAAATAGAPPLQPALLRRQPLRRRRKLGSRISRKSRCASAR